MPGPVSESSKGAQGWHPYVPDYCYPNGKPKMCPCGHHEGFHAENGACLHAQHYSKCGCTGLPPECRTSDEEFHGF